MAKFSQIAKGTRARKVVSLEFGATTVPVALLPLDFGAEAAVISLSTLQKAATDKVPNVRFNAIKALRFVAPLLPPQEVAGGVLPIIKNLAATDSDVDVRFPLFVYACILFEFMLSDRCNFLPQML